MLFIQNGHILDPYTGMDHLSHILIADDGTITDIGLRLTAPAGCPVLDAAGKTVSPGFVDGHVHFRDPGQTEKETLETGAAAAAAGGYTTVICMANTLPTCDNVDTLRDITTRAARITKVHVLQAGAVTKGLRGEELTDFEALLEEGAPCLTDDGINLTGAALCERAMERAAACGALLSFHEEDPTLVDSPGVNFGAPAAHQFGVPGARASAEDAMIGRDIALALRTGARVCFQHVSSAVAVQLIRAGKALGAHICAEVTPHHLSLTQDDVLTYGTHARMNPPLRTEADRQALIAGLLDGTLDMIATDHAPHTAAEKARDFAHAPSGIIGLETAFSVCNSYLVKTGGVPPMCLIERMSCAPARIYGLEKKAVAVGNRAELVLLDWDAPVRYTSYRSKSANSPFTDMPLFGAVCCTVMGDCVVR